MAEKSTKPAGRQAGKHILYLITKSVWGGANTYIYDLATNLSGEFAISVAAGGYDKMAQRLKEQGISYYQINAFQRDINIFKEFLAFFEIFKLLRKIQPDIIHANSSKAGGVAGAAGWFYRLFHKGHVRLIFTAHGWAISEQRSPWQTWLIKIFSKITSFFYDKIICVSEHDQQTALKHSLAAEHKLIAIHNGIDTNIDFINKDAAQQKLINKTSPLVIGTIAEWTHNKGLKYLLEAINRVYPPAGGFDLVLIGSGQNAHKAEILHLINQHPISSNIHAIEFIDNAAQYLKAFDIFVLPSLKEGLPYTIMEAMAAGLPIIATDVGGIPELIEDNITGLLVKPQNDYQLAEKINLLIKNPALRENLGQQAKQKAQNMFGLEQMVEQTQKIY